MEIKGIPFNVNAASGAMGFFGEGYWYHRIFKMCIPYFKRTMDNLKFVSKSTTWKENSGNLPLDENYEPLECFPKCIKVYPLSGMILNAVGAGESRFDNLWKTKKFQGIEREAFGISFIPDGENFKEVLSRTQLFRDRIKFAIIGNNFKSPVWIQVNQSCPNLKDFDMAPYYTREILSVLYALRVDYDVVIDLKVNLLFSNQLIKELYRSNLFDILTVTNTIKFGTEVAGLNWYRIFWWRRDSPLAEFGGGGLSGKPLFNVLCHKIMRLRRDGFKAPIKASGGICSVKRVKKIKECGANAIEFATAILLRPWRIRGMVKVAKRIF